MSEVNRKGTFVNSPFEKSGFVFLNSNMLRCIAIILMLIDHIWATFMSFGNWMTYVGRLAFPIFAFLITEGYIHTSNLKKYIFRLLLFALLSEIPFNLFSSSNIFNPYHQNVLFTLLLGLLAITVIDKCRECKEKKGKLKYCMLLIMICAVSVIGFVDYGFLGLMMVVVFFVFRSFPFAWIAQLVAMIIINVVAFEGQVFIVEFFGMVFEIPTQSFAVLSLLPIWLYNGKKGKSNKLMQYSFYAFYPVHMIVLYLIRFFA